MDEFVLIEVLGWLNKYEDAVSLSLVCKYHSAKIPTLIDVLKLTDEQIVNGFWLPLVGNLSSSHVITDDLLLKAYRPSRTRSGFRMLVLIVDRVDQITIDEWRDILLQPYNDTDEALLKACMFSSCDKEFRRKLVEGNREDCIKAVLSRAALSCGGTIDYFVRDMTLKSGLLILAATKLTPSGYGYLFNTNKSSIDDDTLFSMISRFEGITEDKFTDSTVRILCQHRPGLVIRLIRAGKCKIVVAPGSLELYNVALECDIKMTKIERSTSWKVLKECDWPVDIRTCTPTQIEYLGRCHPEKLIEYKALHCGTYTTAHNSEYSLRELCVLYTYMDKVEMYQNHRCIVKGIMMGDKYATKLITVAMERKMFDNKLWLGIVQDLENGLFYAKIPSRVIAALRILRP